MTCPVVKLLLLLKYMVDILGLLGGGENPLIALWVGPNTRSAFSDVKLSKWVFKNADSSDMRWGLNDFAVPSGVEQVLSGELSSSPPVGETCIHINTSPVILLNHTHQFRHFLYWWSSFWRCYFKHAINESLRGCGYGCGLPGINTISTGWFRIH